MPIVDGKYVAPTWVNGSAPYIDEDEMQAMSDSIEANQTGLDGKAPEDHAVAATTYGKGTGSKYGHVKLYDSYDANLISTQGTAATPAALASLRTWLNTRSGTYTGTGEAGYSHQNSISFVDAHIPTMIVISPQVNYAGFAVLFPGLGTGVHLFYPAPGYGTQAMYRLFVSATATAVSWYGADYQQQMNGPEDYDYYAIY